ncbi:uncharacterized protein LOC115704758 [Cannabis sativa]|uniref:uncharacterized protein LOC115704758 n=1 Tax=Cannabis sativa TaxID=3483 RepID=UPI0011DF85A1|nr:uncharacterized protein LOC115704758 [Cannabis sativa]
MKTQKDMMKKNTKKGVKVVYISSPMKVKTSASEFRALVQELTGINSDAERYMENNNINGVGVGSDTSLSSYSHHHHHNILDQQEDQRLRVKTEDHHLSSFSINTISDHFFDFSATTSSEYLSLIPTQTFGNDRSIFS